MEKTRIIVPHGKIKKIAELFGLNPLTIRKALRGDESVKKFEKIRKVAREMGGIELKVESRIKNEELRINN